MERTEVPPYIKVLIELQRNSLYRAARFANLEGILVKAGLMKTTMQRARPASLRMILDCLRIAKEIVMVSGFFVEGRRQTLLYYCK